MIRSAAYSPNPVTGGQICVFTVGFNSAVSADTTLYLTTDKPWVFANMPSSVVVPNGSATVNVDVTTNTVGATTVATVTSSAAGYASSASGLTVTP